MSAVASNTPQLFARVLGDSWRQLAEKLKQFHTYDGTLTATGTFQVRHGRWPASWLAWLMGLPAAGDNVGLNVTESNGVERWERSFNGKPMVTYQLSRAEGLLTERVGLTEVYFRLTVCEAALHFQTIGAALRIGPCRLPLPALLRPTITASESYDEARGEIVVRVEVRLPLLGRLIEYGGTLEPTKITLQKLSADSQSCGATP